MNVRLRQWEFCPGQKTLLEIVLSDKWKNFLDARISSFVYIKTQLHP